MSEKNRNCNRCIHGLFDGCDVLQSNVEFREAKNTGKRDNVYEFKSTFVCDKYESCYIEFPVTINNIEVELKGIGLYEKSVGKYAKVRPCSEEYAGKTYLGLFLGELPVGINITRNNETAILRASYDLNPAIFVFALNKIIYGINSWWGFIENESDLEDITDRDIENVWYVKELQSLNAKGEN